MVVDSEVESHRFHIVVGTGIGKEPPFAFIRFDERLDGLGREFARRIFVAVGDDGYSHTDGGVVFHLGMQGGAHIANGVVERRAAARLEIFQRDIFHLINRCVFVDGMQAAIAELHKGHEVRLPVILLGSGADAAESFVHAAFRIPTPWLRRSRFCLA